MMLHVQIIHIPLGAHLDITPTLNNRNPKFEPDLTPRRFRVQQQAR
jgi:hypothetical protein